MTKLIKLLEWFPDKEAVITLEDYEKKQSKIYDDDDADYGIIIGGQGKYSNRVLPKAREEIRDALNSLLKTYKVKTEKWTNEFPNQAPTIIGQSWEFFVPFEMDEFDESMYLGEKIKVIWQNDKQEKVEFITINIKRSKQREDPYNKVNKDQSTKKIQE